MKLEGGCFCGAVRYEAEGDPVMKGQCYCRQCQYFAGGAPNIFLALPLAGFKVTKGTPTTFKRADAAVLPAERAFCPTCGVQLTTHADALPEVIFLKVGSLDEPARFDGADVAIFTCDKQPSTRSRRAPRPSTSCRRCDALVSVVVNRRRSGTKTGIRPDGR